MKDDRGSRTAERVAERRAAHQLLDKPPVFEDPLALTILDPAAASRIRANPLDQESSRLSPFLRAAFAVRSRFAEDELGLAVDSGVRQYVVLGAGFDTFAYRNPYAGLLVFEVDHPATQEIKRRRLAEAGIAVPAELVYVPIDFARRSLAEALADAGFRSDAPAFFSWLGVVPYLERPAIEATLRFVGSLPRGTAIVFDYGRSPSSLNFVGRMIFERMASRVAAVGEPWKTFFEPEELHAILHDAGFSTLEDLGPSALNARYFTGRADGLRVGEMLHIINAAI